MHIKSFESELPGTILQRGKNYYKNGAVTDLHDIDNAIGLASWKDRLITRPISGLAKVANYSPIPPPIHKPPPKTSCLILRVSAWPWFAQD